MTAPALDGGTMTALRERDGVVFDAEAVSAMQSWRRAIHRNPELGFEEHETSRLVAERLREWGYEVTTGIASTGVVGTLRWGLAEGAPRLGLRAGMDALPSMIDEGLFERFPCDAVFAMHNHPGMPVGHVDLREGAFLASSDKVPIRFRGKGGHGAMPHLAADP
jgi:metal-dependent amidase/aminoacylase/carboxypeptidase family protein